MLSTKHAMKRLLSLCGGSDWVGGGGGGGGNLVDVGVNTNAVSRLNLMYLYLLTT